LYSFDIDKTGAMTTYQAVIEAYEKLFKELQLDVTKGIVVQMFAPVPTVCDKCTAHARDITNCIAASIIIISG